MSADAQARGGPVIHFEVGPLKEREFTGISQVTASLAAQMLGDRRHEFRFFYGRMLVENEVIADVLERRSGDLLEWLLARARLRPAPEAMGRLNAAIFPNVKSVRGGFDREYQIIHDFSTLLTPQFHHPDTIAYHAFGMEADITTNSLTFCVSEATRTDVLRYFPAIAPSRVVATPLAASPPPDAAQPDPRPCEPYILVLGTIEPRKNITQVLEYVRANPAILRNTRIVFLGRFGWGEGVESLLGRMGLSEAVASGRLMFPGFVNEATKHALIERAELVIYPSLFEGFGLPVLEALAAGVPCVTTRSSSLPEAGGPCAYYFDPFTPGDFDRALMTALLELRIDREGIRARSLEWASHFSWELTFGRMMDAIDADLGQGGGQEHGHAGPQAASSGGAGAGTEAAEAGAAEAGAAEAGAPHGSAASPGPEGAEGPPAGEAAEPGAAGPGEAHAAEPEARDPEATDASAPAEGPEQPGPEQPGPEQPGSEQPGPEQPGPEPTGASSEHSPEALPEVAPEVEPDEAPRLAQAGE